MIVMDNAIPNGETHRVSIYGLMGLYFGANRDCGAIGEPPIDLARCAKVKNWATGSASMEFCEALKGSGWNFELIFDAAHGRRYRLATWPNSFDPLRAAMMRRVARCGAVGLDRTGD